MRTGTYPQRQHFDNLSYISDGRDHISYRSDPYAISTRSVAFDGNAVVLQPSELKQSRRDNNVIYKYRPGQDNIYAYNNAAFSDISGANSRVHSTRSQNTYPYDLQQSYDKIKSSGKIRRICSKYWYVFGMIALIILVVISVGVGVAIYRSRNKSTCHSKCAPDEKMIQLNSTYCECQFTNGCELDPPVCGLSPCIKLNSHDYECQCIVGYQHPPATNDLTDCEDINECLISTTCGQHQICQNTNGSYRCFCEDGYEVIATTNELICRDKDECLDSHVCSNGKCINTNGSFECVCNPGFRLDIFNKLHCEDINECATLHNCTGDNEICENTNGSYTCICASGFRRDEHGHCLNINECSESNTICDANSRCEDRNGTFACCMNMTIDECIECGYNHAGSRSFGTLSAAYSTLLKTTNAPTTRSLFANYNTKTRLNAYKKKLNKKKSKTVANHVRRVRMTDGQPVEVGHFPWIAVLLIKKDYYDGESRRVCIASLVSSWNLVTAAHCLDEQHFRKEWHLTKEPSSFKDLFDIRIGVHNLSMNSTDFIQSESYSIANFTLHSEYQPLHSEDVTVKYDIAIIKLSKRIERSSTTDWICLPTTVSISDQTTLKVVSYGNVNDDLVQQQVDIRVQNNQDSNSECLRQLSDIAEDAFCAMSTNYSSLLGVGDSGAGAMSLDNNRWYLSGIMSKTGIYRAYSAMTNVSKHVSWLKSLMER